MNYTKAMIDLISEARRRAPSDDKPSIKLANPDVLSELNKIYHNSTDTVLKAIIKEAFYLAEEGWPEKLLGENEGSEDDETTKSSRYITKVYRGQTQLIEVESEAMIEKSAKTERIYRGRAIT